VAFIEIENLFYKVKSKNKNIELLNNINLSVNQSDMVTLIGNNGVGKTTLSKLIIGAIKPDKGKILLDGRDLQSYSKFEIGKKVGYLFQNPQLQLFNTSIKEELLFAYEFGSGITKEVLDKYKKIIKKLSLEKALNTPIHHLSRGEKQRVAIGTILMNNPKFIIFDEPTVGLDSIRKKEFINIITELYNDGIGMFFISHDNDFIESLPTKIIKLSEGRILDVSN